MFITNRETFVKSVEKVDTCLSSFIEKNVLKEFEDVVVAQESKVDYGIVKKVLEDVRLEVSLSLPSSENGKYFVLESVSKDVTDSEFFRIRLVNGDVIWVMSGSCWKWICKESIKLVL